MKTGVFILLIVFLNGCYAQTELLYLDSAGSKINGFSVFDPKITHDSQGTTIFPTLNISTTYSKDEGKIIFYGEKLILKRKLLQQNPSDKLFSELYNNDVLVTTVYKNQNFVTAARITRDASYFIDFKNTLEYIYYFNPEGKKIAPSKYLLNTLYEDANLYCIDQINFEEQIITLLDKDGIKTSYKLTKIKNPSVN